MGDANQFNVWVVILILTITTIFLMWMLNRLSPPKQEAIPLPPNTEGVKCE